MSLNVFPEPSAQNSFYRRLGDSVPRGEHLSRRLMRNVLLPDGGDILCTQPCGRVFLSPRISLFPLLSPPPRLLSIPRVVEVIPGIQVSRIAARWIATRMQHVRLVVGDRLAVEKERESMGQCGRFANPKHPIPTRGSAHQPRPTRLFAARSVNIRPKPLFPLGGEIRVRLDTHRGLLRGVAPPALEQRGRKLSLHSITRGSP